MSRQHLLGLHELPDWLMLTGILVATVALLSAVLVVLKYGSLWLQAKMSHTDVSLTSLIGMSLRKVKPATIVNAQVMASQAGLTISPGRGMSTASLEAHYLAGGDVKRVF